VLCAGGTIQTAGSIDLPAATPFRLRDPMETLRAFVEYRDFSIDRDGCHINLDATSGLCRFCGLDFCDRWSKPCADAVVNAQRYRAQHAAHDEMLRGVCSVADQSS
jgi:hypothetical protein